MTKIAIASDHAGYELKTWIIQNISPFEWLDCGTNSSERCDYPDYAEKVGRALQNNQAKVGVLICGSGIGMSIAANKLSGIRAAVVETPTAAALAKQHNNANVLCLGARLITPALAKEIFFSWYQANFENGRHSARIAKITALELPTT